MVCEHFIVIFTSGKFFVMF